MVSPTAVSVAIGSQTTVVEAFVSAEAASRIGATFSRDGMEVCASRPESSSRSEAGAGSSATGLGFERLFGFEAVLLSAFRRRNRNWFGQDRGERYSGFLRRTFRSFALVFGGLAVDSLAIAYRDPEIVGMDLAERQEPMSNAAVIDKRGLKRRLDAGDLSEIDVAFYLPLCGRF